MSAEQADQRITLRRQADRSGRILGFVRRQWKKRWVKWTGIILSLPFFLYGTRASLRSLIREWRDELGISYVAIPGQAMDEFAPIVQELRGS